MIAMNESPNEESIDRFFGEASDEQFIEESAARNGLTLPPLDDSFDEVAFLEETIVVEEDDEPSKDDVSVDGLQFGLHSLLSVMLLTGGLLELWLTRNLIFLSAALIALFVISWRRPPGWQRTSSLLMYGGGLGVCGGLILSFSSSSGLGFLGLLFASFCSFVALHGALAPMLAALASRFSGE